jgi:hypothetical protein
MDVWRLPSIKKDKVIWHVAGNQDQPVKRFQITLVPGFVAQELLELLYTQHRGCTEVFY